jgi:beta-aspartyl-dipeptidase (metallo-type)
MGGTKILGVYPPSSVGLPSGLVTVINATGKLCVPGLIDPHVHVSGGGGEIGPDSRTPNAQLSQILDSGITSFVGIRGTDGVTRSGENLLQFLLSFEQMGLSTWMWTGSYQMPVDTLFSSVERDIILIEKIVGAGEIAISDHRGSWPSFQQLVELVSSCRRGGMLSGKAGIAYFHVGDGPTMLDPLWEIVNKTTIPITQMYPTHVSSRGARLVKEGARWVEAGGFVDFTADAPGEDETTAALNIYRSRGVDLSHVTLSSDSYGSLPEYDQSGTVIGYGVASPMNLIQQLRTLVLNDNWPLDLAWALATSNTASYLQIPGKGQIIAGNDGDLLDPIDLSISFLFANGALLKSPTNTTTAMFPCM